jgi:leucyl-tRNA synthetase
MREEFAYFYPLDTRQSGRDLVPNHLSFFIFNHVAIFPKELWPKQIIVNGSVLMEGKKMSKSLGNILPLREALKMFGADPLRLAILVTAGLLQDADFSPSLAQNLRERVERFYTWAMEVIALAKSPQNEEFGIEERWLMSRLMKAIESTTASMEKLKVREAVQTVLYSLDQDIQWYMRKKSAESLSSGKGPSGKVLNDILETRVRLLTPFTPYICEDIWHAMGREGLVANASWPTCDETKIDAKAEETIEMMKNIIEDTLSILKATKRQPKRIFYYTCASWKWKVYLKVLEKAELRPLDLSALMKELTADPSLKNVGKDLPKMVQKYVEEFSKTAQEVRRTKSSAGMLDEYTELNQSKQFFQKELNAEVVISSEEDKEKIDPKDRARLALPHRPAIYIE